MAVTCGVSVRSIRYSAYARLTSDSGSILCIKVRIYLIEQVERSRIALLDGKDCVSCVCISRRMTTEIEDEN
jgi:hypothetical protein